MRLVTKFFSDQDQFDTSFDGTSSGNNSMAADASFRKAVMAASGQCTGGLAVKTNGIWRRSDIFYSGFSFFQRFLRQTGILDELKALGIEEGDTVRVGEYLEFDYYD